MSLPPPSGELAGTHVVLDASVELLAGATVVVGGSPLRVIRLSARGAELVEHLAHGDEVPAGAAPTALVRRLLDGGLVHPDWSGGSPDAPEPAADVTVVVPVRGALDPQLLAALGPVAAVVVVDDASPVAVSVPASTPDGAPVRLVRRTIQGGPAAARNDGLALVDTCLVALVDADCVPRPGWLQILLPHFSDPAIAVVAPRITAATDRAHGLLARYETAWSALDMGPRPARVRARTRMAYVPSAALVARTAALREVGGFDPGLRVGEDVDLVWRLDRDGWTVRYEPLAEVDHRHRTRPVAWLRRRFDYGTSAGLLARRHPGLLAPVELSGWRTTALAEHLAAVGDPELAPRLVAAGRRTGLRQLARALLRPWWPVTLLAIAIVPSRRVRVAIVAVVASAAIRDWLDDGAPTGLGTFLVGRLGDDLAYGTGVWVGCVRARTTEPLRPVLRWAATPR